MFVQTKKIKALLPGLMLAAMLAFLLLFSPVYAEGEQPPEEPVSTVEESPPSAEDEVQVPVSQEEPMSENSAVDDPAPEPADEAAPASPGNDPDQPTEPTPLPEEDPTAEELVLVDSNGDPLDFTSQETSQLLADPDPYFYVGGVLYNFTATDCDPITPSNQACANPIQAAIDFLSSNNLKPDTGKIYVEAGSFLGFTIDGSAWALNKPTLIDLIGAGSGSTNITSTVFVSNLVNFYMTGFNITGQLNLQNNTGTIKLTDIKVKNTSGTGLFIGAHSGSVSINNLTAFENNWFGADIDNTSGIGAVTITNSYFKNNVSTGLLVMSKGVITLSNVHSTKNEFGANIYNNTSSGTPLVKVNLSTFNDNTLSGLTVFSKGNITLDNVIAAGNGHKGTLLANDTGTGLVVVKNSQFLSNQFFGLEIYSSRTVTLDGVLAANNAGKGVSIQNQTSPTSGYPVTILRSNFSSNSNYGLEVWSKSLIKLDNITALNNGSTGAVLNNNFSGGTGGVTIAAVYGENYFSNNGFYGLQIESKGTVSLSKVFANANVNNGVYIANDSGLGNVTINQSRFEYNGGYGGVIFSKGAVTIDRVVGSYNSSAGLYIDNATDFLSPKTIKITRSRFEFNTSNSGLFIDAKSNVILDNVTASFNSGYGVRIDNCQYGVDACQGIGSISILSSLGANNFNNNNIDNMYIYASGNILFSKVTANNSISGSGIWASNSDVIANITLTNVSTMFNSVFGTFAYTAGNIKVTNSNFSNNTNSGGYFSTLADLTGLRTISISGSIFNNTSSHGAEINGTGNITLSNITATNNLNGDGVRINNLDGAGFVSISGSFNQFVNNGQRGVYIQSNGAVSMTNVTASNNGLWGAEINNSNSPLKFPVTVKNSAFNHNGGNGGIYIRSQGNILIDLVNASYNPGNWAGGSFENTNDITGLKTITIQRSIFNFNGGGGIGASSYGTITLNNVSASYNTSWHGVSLNNQGGLGNIVFNNSLGENLLIGNNQNGLNIYTDHNITLRSVHTLFNGGDGAYLNQVNGPNGSTTIISSTFSNNLGYGLNLNSVGSISMDKVDARSNGSTGLHIFAINAPVDTYTTTLTRVNASNNNYHGISIQSSGLVTLNTFKIFNNGEHGLYLSNNIGGATMGINILSQYGANWTSGNYKLGAHIISSGPVSISKIVALGNGISTNFAGLFIQTTNNQNITLTCALLSGNGYHGLTANLGTGTLTLNGVTAYGNDVFGGSVDPDIFNNVGSTVITNPASCGTFQ